jgi:hypothetical protein
LIDQPSSEVSDTDRRRQSGEDNLLAAMRYLSGSAQRAASLVKTYNAKCSGAQASDQAYASCESLIKQIVGLALDVARGLERAEEDARRAGVMPGTVRDLRERAGLGNRFWDDLAAEIRRLESEARSKGRR